MKYEFEKEVALRHRWAWRTAGILGVACLFAVGGAAKEHAKPSQPPNEAGRDLNAATPDFRNKLELPKETAVQAYYLTCESISSQVVSETISSERAIVIWAPTTKNDSHILNFAFSEKGQDQYYVDYFSGSENQLVQRQELLDKKEGLFVSAYIDDDHILSMRMYIDDTQPEEVRLRVACLSPAEAYLQQQNHNSAIGQITK